MAVRKEYEYMERGCRYSLVFNDLVYRVNAKQVSVMQLHRISGYAEQTIRDLLNGRYKANVIMFFDLCEIAGVNITAWLTPTEELLDQLKEKEGVHK